MSITVEKELTTLRGIFKGGVIVLTDAVTLPDGTAVIVTFPQEELPTELREEFARWDRAGADAWKLIAQWEAEEGSDPETLA